MRVKTYRGANTSAVLARIKSELGADAVILSTRTYKEDGESVAEVTAALEDLRDEREETRNQEPAESGLDGEAFDAARPPAPEAWGQWHQEWSRIKEHLTTLLRPQLDFGLLAPIQRQALEYLEREGLETEVVMDIYSRLKGRPKTSILGPLEAITAVKPWSGQQWPQRFHALAGPAGVGKTQALLRMALERKQENEGLRVCLVNADTRRMKSKVVLQHYAELASLDYREISEPMDTAALLAQARQWDLVLVDLPALERGRGLEEQLQELGLDAVDDLCVHIALSPHFAPAQLRELTRRYAARKAASLVWTKLDESYSFGAMVNVAWSTGLACSILSYGAGLSGTMSAARHLDIWRLLFKHRLPGEEQ